MYLRKSCYLFIIFYIIAGIINCGSDKHVKKDEFSFDSTDKMGQAGSKIVTVEGIAEVRQAGIDEAYDRAEENAKNKAIESALGTIIDARLLGSSGQILEETIYAKKQGYIRRSEIISKRVEDRVTYVTIKAEVGLQKLKDDVLAMDILQQRMNMPKTIIFVKEENLGQPSAQRASYNVLVNKFQEKKFTIISPSTINQTYNKNLNNLYSLMESDENAFISIAGKIGLDVNADIVIVGKAISQKAGKIMEGSQLNSYQADVDFKVVNIGDGKIIAASAKHGAAPHLTDISGGINAIQKAAELAADDLLDKILKAWEDILNNGNLITLYVNGLSLTEELTFEKLLKGYYREVRAVYSKGREGDKSVCSVKFLGQPRDLAKALTTKPSFPYNIEILKYDFGEVAIKAVRK